jgi:drug/metabolite transporter (DMT)-like permease
MPTYNTHTKAYLALAFICFFWGTTYLAVRIGVSDFPPFIFAGVRQTIAGLLLLAFIIFSRRDISIGKEDFIHQLIPGILMVAIGNGVVAWASKYIPSGITAIITSIMPVYVVLINLVNNRKNSLNAKIVSGLLLGIVGLLLIFKDHLVEIARPEYFWGTVVTLLSAFAWAIGSVYIKNNPRTSHPFVNASLQLFIGGIAMLGISVFVDDWNSVHSIPVNSIWAMIYLIAFGSIGAYICYLYAMKHLPVGLVSVHAYINPVVAVILGYLILDEKITWMTVVAMLTILSGVYLMNRGYSATYISKEKK